MVEKSRSFDRETLKIFWQAALRDRRGFAMALFFPLGGLLLNVGVPLLVGRIIAGLSTGQDPMKYIPWLVGTALAAILFNRLGAPALFELQARTMGYLQTRAFEALIRRSMGFHNDRVGGKLVSDATDFPNAYNMLVDALFTNLLPFVLILVVGTGAVFIESWQLGLIVLAMVSYALGSAWRYTRQRAPLRRKRLAVAKAVTSHLADTVVNVPTVKTFAQEDHELASHHRLNSELTDIRIIDWNSGARDGSVRITVILTLEVCFVITLAYLVKRDPSLLAVGIFVFSFIGMISVRLFQLNVLLRQMEDGFLNASPMTEILLQEPEVKDAPHAKELKVTDGVVDFSDVQFRYSDANQETEVFSKLSLTIKPGEKIGLVGPSGGGKSTMTRLLLRFEDIDAGSITIDKQDIATVTQSSLRQAISYVPQEPLLFHRTIAENIAYGLPEATSEAIEAAAKKAFAHDFIMSLSAGYDTIVGERGVKLSGGQRQRVAIARAILKDAPILVLDEATSALDSESEAYIQKALWDLMQGRTALVIAHRLSTVQQLDRIIVLEDGALTEQGTHKQLLTKKGTYAMLWKRQSGGFIED